MMIVYKQLLTKADHKYEQTNRERTESSLIFHISYEQSALPKQFEIVLAVLLFTKPHVIHQATSHEACRVMPNSYPE